MERGGVDAALARPSRLASPVLLRLRRVRHVARHLHGAAAAARGVERGREPALQLPFTTDGLAAPPRHAAERRRRRRHSNDQVLGCPEADPPPRSWSAPRPREAHHMRLGRVRGQHGLRRPDEDFEAQSVLGKSPRPRVRASAAERHQHLTTERRCVVVEVRPDPHHLNRDAPRCGAGQRPQVRLCQQAHRSRHLPPRGPGVTPRPSAEQAAQAAANKTVVRPEADAVLDAVRGFHLDIQLGTVRRLPTAREASDLGRRDTQAPEATPPESIEADEPSGVTRGTPHRAALRSRGSEARSPPKSLAMKTPLLDPASMDACGWMAREVPPRLCSTRRET